MTDQEFNQQMKKHNLDRRIFTLGKTPNDCMYTIQIGSQGYEVYYFERGIKEYTRLFPERGDALAYLLELLLADSRAKL